MQSLENHQIYAMQSLENLPDFGRISQQGSNIYIYSANTSPEDLAQEDPAKTAILPGGVKKASEMSGGGGKLMTIYLTGIGGHQK